MVLDRRTALRLVGTAALGSAAGCATLPGGRGDPAREYALDVDGVDASPVEYALYRPGDSVYDRPANRALEAILPDGRHTTYGFEPLPEDAYLERDGRYYQVKAVVTGQREIERHLVRASRVPEDEVPEDAIAVDSLPRATARVVKVLHSHSVSNGGSGAAEILRGDAYVLRRPYEIESRLTADLDGRVLAMDEEGRWAYRLDVATEAILEPVYATFAVELADARAAFREVVFATRIDSRFEPSDLSADVRDVLEAAIDRGAYRETAPLSAAFESLLGALRLAGVESGSNGHLLWYRDALYRYGLYVNRLGVKPRGLSVDSRSNRVTRQACNRRSRSTSLT
jgi:hypothetical protein